MTKQGLLKLVVEIWTIYQIGLWTPFTPSQNYGHLSQQYKIMDTFHSITKLWTPFTASQNYGHLHSITKLWTPFTASQNYGHLSQHHKNE